MKPLQKLVALDQVYSLVQPSYVSPFMFCAKLLVYSIARINWKQISVASSFQLDQSNYEYIIFIYFNCRMKKNVKKISMGKKGTYAVMKRKPEIVTLARNWTLITLEFS